MFQKTYGKSVTLENGSTGTADILIENPELLTGAHGKPKPPTLPAVNPTSNNPIISQPIVPIGTSNGFNDSSASALYISGSEETMSNSNALRKQTEIRTADGKRRITPVFVALNQDVS